MGELEGLEGMKIDNSMPQVNQSVFPGNHGVIALTWERTWQTGMASASLPGPQS